MHEHPQYTPHLLTWAIGALVGIGQLLLGDGELTVRKIFGRALVSGGLGASAGAVLVWWPDANIIAVFGTAAGLASLGTSGIEKFLEARRNRE